MMHGLRWMQARISPQSVLMLLVLGRILAVAWFAQAAPLWSSFDEINHYLYARFIAQEGRLPQDTDYPPLPPDLRAYVQYNQLPLYYIMMAPVAATLDNADPPLLPAPNPAPICLNSPDLPFLQAMPGSAINLSAWLMRGLTMGLGLLSIVFTWLAARSFWPLHPMRAHAAAALLAIWPPAIELSIWINSDAPLMAWGALFVWAAARILARPPRLRDWLLLALALGLCLGTKSTGAVVLLPAALLIWWRLHLLRRLHNRLSGRGLGIMMGVTLAGLILLIVPAVNLLRCGQILCRVHRATPMFDSWERFVYFLQRPDYEANLAYLARSATVPWLDESLMAPDLLYWLGGAGLLLGALLLPWALIRDHRERPVLFCLLLCLLGAFGLALLRVWWFPYTVFMPVRYLALAFPALMLLLACLLMRYGWALLTIPLGTWLGLTLIVPPLLYAPLYPAVTRLEALPDELIRVEDYRFASGVELGAYTRIESEAGHAGLRLYLRQDAPAAQRELRYAWLSLWDGDLRLELCGIVLGGVSWPNTHWQPGEWVAQDFYFAALDSASHFELRLTGVEEVAYLLSVAASEESDPHLSEALLRLQGPDE